MIRVKENIMEAFVVVLSCFSLWCCQDQQNDMSNISNTKKPLSQANPALSASAPSFSVNTPITASEREAQDKASKPVEQQEPKKQRIYYEARALATRQAIKTQRKVLTEAEKNLDSTTGNERATMEKELKELKKSIADKEKRLKEYDAKSR